MIFLTLCCTHDFFTGFQFILKKFVLETYGTLRILQSKHFLCFFMNFKDKLFIIFKLAILIKYVK